MGASWHSFWIENCFLCHLEGFAYASCEAWEPKNAVKPMVFNAFLECPTLSFGRFEVQPRRPEYPPHCPKTLQVAPQAIPRDPQDAVEALPPPKVWDSAQMKYVEGPKVVHDLAREEGLEDFGAACVTGDGQDAYRAAACAAVKR